MRRLRMRCALGRLRILSGICNVDAGVSLGHGRLTIHVKAGWLAWAGPKGCGNRRKLGCRFVTIVSGTKRGLAELLDHMLKHSVCRAAVSACRWVDIPLPQPAES